MRVHALFSRQRVITALTLLLGLLSPAIITVRTDICYSIAMSDYMQWVWANSVPVLVHKPPSAECRIRLRLSDMQYVL